MASKQIPEKQDLGKQIEMEKMLQKEGEEIRRHLLCWVWTVGVTVFVRFEHSFIIGAQNKKRFLIKFLCKSVYLYNKFSVSLYVYELTNDN